MINKIPFFGWFLSFVANVSLSIPFWLCWTVFEIGQKYFYFVPTVYQSIPFWSCVGLFVVISILKSVFVPTVAAITNNNNNK